MGKKPDPNVRIEVAGAVMLGLLGAWLLSPQSTNGQDAVAAGKTTLTTEVQVLPIGDYFIVGLPSEVFVEYQIEMRERSGADFTFVSDLANDSISCVPTPKAYEEGGYEVRSSSLAPEAGKALVDAAIELVAV